ncbi:MAG TPA: transglutaminase family protein, partial [Steroidobacteraceae bacterium]|nr:transglutaminase family protein [Steroidobacteraceae bacterium]
CEVYLPGAGWIGLDPTSGLLAGEGHIPLACTPEPSAAAPISGAVEKSEVKFAHTMSVRRLWQAPRVTKPYSDEQWQRIVALGRRVDTVLEAADVRLTMGGEPTFVSMDDPGGAEWNMTAMGPNKRRLASELYHRLRRQYAPQGLVHFGQGKWYPGEPLPRWALSCFWRRDGQPVWSDADLVADESHDYGATAETAAAFVRGVAAQLDLDPDFAFPAFEDAFYYLWRERRLPGNVDPLDSHLEDALERARLMRLFDDGGLAQPAGCVLPLARSPAGTEWQTSSWFLRAERCYLVPGDSPIGYRLPLDSLPWTRAADHPYVHAADPLGEFAPLPETSQLRRPSEPRPTTAPQDSAAAAPAPAPGQSATGITRGALCAEARGGVLYVFMPPLAQLEDYLQLVSAVEATAQALKLPVMLEGYEPPTDPRLNVFKVTPDPGVIEVNIHPAHRWDELVERTEFLYGQARETRLATEKFMLDGRHTGTGGGNHFVLGGQSSADSPFLRRPDLLGSLLAYWHNHPALSYLFSGLFIGPTSQAPRVDEARNDSLYELEIAMQQLPAPGVASPPWLADRLFRNLLIDVTGNTHRAEFCIDKLYSPDGAAGRLGLLELRAFEMPPHYRMSLAQQLLLRALVARFWHEPYQPARLARWGTELHDRFMLPYFIAQDLRDVLAESAQVGYALDEAWFAPHFEFRFPKYGDYAVSGTELELR